MIKPICIREEDSGPMEPLDEAWNFLSGSFLLTLKPALSSAFPAWMDICDHCLHTCCSEILEVAADWKGTQCVSTPRLLIFRLCTYCFLLMCRKSNSSFQTY